MDKYVEATGGKAAYEAIKSRIVKAEATMPGGGMTGKMEVYAAYPDKFRADGRNAGRQDWNVARTARPCGSVIPASAADPGRGRSRVGDP